MEYVLITGASSGIGYDTALEFAKLNKSLIVVARREDELEKLKREVLKINDKLEVIVKVCDLTKMTEVYKLYEEVKGLDIKVWMNNAGFGNFDKIADQDLEKMERMIDLNIKALMILSTLYVRDFKDKEGTQLINVSSGGGYYVVSDAVTYCATKFFVSAFTEGLAKELVRTKAKMRAKVLAPAATETEFAKNALDTEEFEYEGALKKFNTSKEMAGYVIKLYKNEKTVGIVNGKTYEFNLVDEMFNHVGNERNIEE